MSNAVGRRADKIWSQYSTEKDPITGKVVSNVCNMCLKQISAQPCRMWKHLNKCKTNRGLQLSAATAMAAIVPPLAAPSMEQMGPPPPPPKKQKIIVCEFPVNKNPNINFDINSIKTGKRKKEELDECLGELIFGLNLPLTITQHHLFQKFVKTLRPTYNLPPKEHLSSSILEKAYENNQRRLWETLKNKKVAIWQDICSSHNAEPVITHYLCTIQKNYLLHSVPTSFECMANAFYANLLEAAIERAESEFECKVIAVLTEKNEIGTSLQWHLQDRFPNLVVYTCHTRLLQHVAQNLVPLNILDPVNAVQKHFRDHAFESEALLQLNGNKPYVSVNANWESQSHCLRSFLDNHSKYVEIFSSENPNLIKDERVITTMRDENVFSKVDKSLESLQLILSTIEKVQSDSICIADAVSHWMTLDERSKELVTSDVFQTAKQAALTPVAIASYMLHPIYRGKNLTGAQNTLGFEFLTSKNPLFVAAAINLQQSDSNFYPISHLNLAVAEHLAPSVWWRSLAKFENISGELIDFCETLMSIPASTKNMRDYSLVIDDIFNKNISNLDVEKIQMLCSIYHQQTNNN